MKSACLLATVFFGMAFSAGVLSQTPPGTPQNPVPMLPPGTSVIAVAADGSIWKCTGTAGGGVTCTMIQAAPIPPPPPKER